MTPKDLTVSSIDRENILNNGYALSVIQESIWLKGFQFDWKIWFSRKQVADFFEVDRKTIDRALDENDDELRNNGYEVFTGERLREAKNAYVRDIIVPNPDDDLWFHDSTPRIWLFDFRSFLDLAMLLKESKKAQEVRWIILDLAISAIHKKTKWNTKYINTRDKTFLSTLYSSENYRKKFTDTLRDCVEMSNMKYPIFTDKIYQIAFHEKSKEYKDLLWLSQSDNMRNTLYSEVLDAIAWLENGISDLIRQDFNVNGKLTRKQAEDIFENAKDNPFIQPLIEKAKRLMASRDNAFREVYHAPLADYIGSVSVEDFERFIWEKSQDFEKTLEETKDVIARLKDR